MRLATFPITAGVPNAQQIFDVTFLLVVVFTVIQGPTLPWAASRLAVVEPEITAELEIEHAPFEDIGASMLTCDIPKGSLLHGVEISELRLPGDATVALILRDGILFAPKPSTSAAFEAAIGSQRAISRAGRLATWRGELGLLS